MVIRNGVVIDGTGSPPFLADVGVKDGMIAKIGDLSGARAEVVVDAGRSVVAPGFIDLHNHSEVSIFALPTADNYVLQGVTTLVVGNCGFSPAPLTERNAEIVEEVRERYPDVRVGWKSFREYLEALDSLEKSVNVAVLVGFGAIRSAVMGFEDARPTASQLGEMKELVEEAMSAGAFGMSTGLIYTPQSFAGTGELVELCRVVSRHGGIYATHLRDEGLGLVDSVMEAVNVGRSSGCPVEISHLKSAGRPAWGLVNEALRLIEYYGGRGLDVSADAYPYTATSTALSAVLPQWVREGGTRRMLERISEPGTLARIAEELERRGVMGGRYVEWWQVVVSWSLKHAGLEGRSIEEISREWGLDPVRTVVKLLTDDEGLTEAVFHILSEEDVKRVLRSPYTAVGSDGSVKRLGEGRPHPRSYGTFPRVLAKYVREERVLSLPEAVRKMTSMPARKLRLWDRGIIRPGMRADIVVFNPYTIRDTATFANPHSYPRGIEYVMVNGVLVVEDGRHTGRRPGRLLRRET